MTGKARPLTVFLVAGEPSGDRLGARIMTALQAECTGPIEFLGVGGAAMAQAGLASRFPIAEISVMGLVEVLPHLPRILRRLRETAAAVRAARPDILVTIDAPGFNLRLARRLKGEGIPLLHVVAPSVWAWKPWRARQVAGYLDHLLALLPFEPPYFERHGLATTFIGHPAVEALAASPTRGEARQGLGLAEKGPVITVLPGSRLGEVRRMGPVFGKALGLLKARFPDLAVLLPTVETVAGAVRDLAAGWPLPTQVLEGEPAKAAGFAASDAALAASGTVAVELAVAGLPAVIGYRVHPLTAVLARRMIKVPFVSLPNLVLGEAVQPEFLQEACRPAALAEAVAALLENDATRTAHRAKLGEAARRLGLGGEPPSRRAAWAILAAIGSGGALPAGYNAENPQEEP